MLTFWNRAYLHVIRKKGKSLLMFLILLTIATLLLTCLAIQSAGTTAAANIRTSLMGGFTINATHADNMLEQSTIDAILNLSGIRPQYNLRSSFQAEYQKPDGTPLTLVQNDAAVMNEGFEHTGKMMGNSHSDKDHHFADDNFELKEGRHVDKDDHNVLLISEELAKLNHLKLDDDLLLKDTQTGKYVNVKIIGIFKTDKTRDISPMTPTMNLDDNIGFTDNAVFYQLNFDQGEHYQYGDFYVDDPADLDDLITKIKQLPAMAWEKCVITKNDADYQNAKVELEALQTLVSAIVMILVAISIVLLALILLLWIRSRIQEIGMLLAMGITKVDIFLQHCLEVFVIGILAFAVSYVTSSLIAQKAGDQMLSQATGTENVTAKNLVDGTSKAKDTEEIALKSIKIEITGRDIMLVYGIGTGIVLLSILCSSYPILRLKPKEILTKMN